MKLILGFIICILCTQSFATETAFLIDEKSLSQILDTIREKTDGDLDFQLTNVTKSKDPEAKIVADIKLNGHDACRETSKNHDYYSDVPKIVKDLFQRSKDNSIAVRQGISLREVKWIFQLFGINASINHWRASWNAYIEQIAVPTCYL